MTTMLTVFEVHQFRIAKQTLKMSDAIAKVMGGMTKEEALRVIEAAKAKNRRRNGC